MAVRRKPRSREAQLAFEAISIEGGLLSPEWLARAAQLSAGNQSESDYRIPKGLNLRDEIGRYWRIAQAHWKDFVAGRGGSANPQAIADRFVTALLREVFGFTSLAVSATPIEIDGRAYPILHFALGRRVPVVIAPPAENGLDALSPAFGDNGRRRSAFGLVQEFLNAEDGALWGLASDGLTLRIVRDNASLTRPAWIEADLSRIFTEERYADFAALWLLAHETRFGREDQPVTECSLEAWRTAGREEGTRAREHLRRGVEDALVALGQGFLAHSENTALRTALQNGSLTTTAYFQQLLRLVYRMIFLLTVEERGVLHADGSSEEARRLYAEGYSLRRLRERSTRRSAHDRFADLWESVKIVFAGLARGEPRLALPALAGIFAADQCAALDGARLANSALVGAVFRLSWLREDSGLSRVNWRDMGPEELGSVYESLLELVPQIGNGGRSFAFATGGETKGNARKTSGSYYTPDSLVQVLLDSALEPVIAQTVAAHPEKPVDALLELSIVDPACGSGHFLLAAARRLAANVARIEANGTPSASEYRHALRQVVGKCIYGVDLNPMAVELCKVSLWMEAVEPGRPLSFLDSHIQWGNALLGTTPELMAKGLPDAAWDPIEGDDKKVASALKKRNKLHGNEAQKAWSFVTSAAANETAVVNEKFAALEKASDESLDALAKKESQWQGVLGSEAYRHQKFVADAWCAAFVWPKQAGEMADAAPTNEVWRQIRDGAGAGKTSAVTARVVGELAEQYRLFHWHLAFPQVFTRGGFDCVLGNPPWEKIQIEEQQYFSASHPEIAAADARKRKKLIENLSRTDPRAFVGYAAAIRASIGTAVAIKECGRFPLTAHGNVATHSLFVELAHQLLSQGAIARLGIIVPSGLATQDSQKALFAFLSDGRLDRLLDFENSLALFVDVHRSFRFALVVARAVSNSRAAEFGFYLKRPDELREPGRLLRIDAAYLTAVSPNTRSCPLARSQRDLDVLLRICTAGIPLKPSDRVGPWQWHSSQMVNETHEADTLVDAHVARPRDEMLRLYEAKLLHQFDHRFATYDDADVRTTSEAERNDPASLTKTRWLVPSTVWSDRIADRNQDRDWIIAFRRIARATDERTFIGAILPKCGAGSQTPVATVGASAKLTAILLGNLNALVFDYATRLRSGGTDLNHFIVNQLFVVHPSRFSELPFRDADFARMLRSVLELTYTAWDLEAFARDVGYDGPPFRWVPERRALLRAELDAAFFHLYGISRDDTAYILDTFPIVRKNDEKAYGEYRTKRLILEVYDAMAEATRTGKAYVTRLDPPPADPRVAHPRRGSA